METVDKLVKKKDNDEDSLVSSDTSAIMHNHHEGTVRNTNMIYFTITTAITLLKPITLLMISRKVSNALIKEVEEALIETAKEADRQKNFSEQQSKNLKRRLLNVERESHIVAKSRINENRF